MVFSSGIMQPVVVVLEGGGLVTKLIETESGRLIDISLYKFKWLNENWTAMLHGNIHNLRL